MITSNTVRFNLTPLDNHNKESGDPHGSRKPPLL